MVRAPLLLSALMCAGGELAAASIWRALYLLGPGPEGLAAGLDPPWAVARLITTHADPQETHRIGGRPGQPEGAWLTWVHVRPRSAVVAARWDEGLRRVRG